MGQIIFGHLLITVFLTLMVFGPEDKQGSYLVCTHIYIALTIILTEIKKISK